MVINVLHSIGDIIFCEPIYRHYWMKEGIKPTVIIRDHLMWMQDYIESAKFLAESKWNGDIDDAVMTEKYIPLRFANQVLREYDKYDDHDFENCMPDKYLLCGLNPDKWMDLQLLFDIEKSRMLFADLNISSEDDYIIVNQHSQAGKVTIQPKTDLKIIEMKEIQGYYVLDWAMIMLLAKENHHVSTSTFFILEALKGYIGKTFIYPRPNEDGLQGISKLNTSFLWEKMQ